MTRMCMDCQRVLGEKCPKCGSELFSLLPDGRLQCFGNLGHRCARIFTRGEGGNTHGLCGECLHKRQLAEDVAAKHALFGMEAAR